LIHIREGLLESKNRRYVKQKMTDKTRRPTKKFKKKENKKHPYKKRREVNKK